LVTNLDLETGKIEGATWDTGYASIEDFLDSLYQKYIGLIGTKKHFRTGGAVVVDWNYVGGDLMIKSVVAEYNGDGTEVEYANSILRHWIFCYAMNFSKVLGVVSVKQQQVK
jgi:hypothetical protein